MSLGEFAVGVCGVALALPQGFDQIGLVRAAAGHPPDRAMLRPEALKGRALVIDPASALAARIATRFRDTAFAQTPADRLGIVVASRYGNATVVREFADRVRRGASAPAAFAASGYNAASGFAAMAIEAHGPSLAIAGQTASLRAAIQRAMLCIERGDADAMIAIGAESRPGDGAALALGVALRHPEAAPLILSDAAFDAATDIAFEGPFAAFPWLQPDPAGPFAACWVQQTHEARNAG